MFLAHLKFRNLLEWYCGSIMSDEERKNVVERSNY